MGELLTGPKNRELNLLCVDETPFALFSVSDLELVSSMCGDDSETGECVPWTGCRKGRVVF